jgi:hypothetical protein
MKKILIAIMLVLMISLVGCGEPDNINVVSHGVSQEDYDLLERRLVILEDRNTELNQALMDFYVITDDGKLYSNCRIEGGIKVCDELDSYITDEELQTNLNYWFNEYDRLFGERNAEMLESLEISQDEQIILNTIAMIDLTVMLYEEQETFTEEEQSYYDLLIAHRIVMVQALEDYDD